MRLRGRASLICLALAALGGCVDVRSFAGSWSGGIVSEEAVRAGFLPEVQVDPLVLSNVELQGITARLTTSDRQFSDTRLSRVIRSANDTIASLTFDGAPLRSYILFAPLAPEPAGSPPASILISLFGDDHVELRVFRGNDLFGVFNLHRKEGQ